MPLVTANPGAGASLSGADTAWTDPGNILSSDDSRASGTVSSGGWMNPLKADNFDFSVIPDSAVILACEVRAEWHTVGTDLGFDDEVFLMTSDTWGTGKIGNDKAFNTTIPTGAGSEAYRTYGDRVSDLWNAALTPAIVKANDFGVGFRMKHDGGLSSTTFNVDHVEMTITYEDYPTSLAANPPSRRSGSALGTGLIR